MFVVFAMVQAFQGVSAIVLVLKRTATKCVAVTIQQRWTSAASVVVLAYPRVIATAKETNWIVLESAVFMELSWMNVRFVAEAEYQMANAIASVTFLMNVSGVVEVAYQKENAIAIAMLMIAKGNVEGLP